MAQSDGASIDLVGVTKTYPRGEDGPLIAVNNVFLSIPAGATVALTGPSGSGKSTLLHLIGAIDEPDTGHIYVAGRDIAALPRKQLPAYRRGVGFVFQRFNLLPGLTALDNVLAPVLPYRTTFDKQARAESLLEAVGLAGREHALPSRLSGGQQQRVAIARALIGSPGLLLADEPTGNLDSRTGASIVDLLLELQKTANMTIMVATHDTALAGRLGRVVRLRDGAIVDDQQAHDSVGLRRR